MAARQTNASAKSTPSSDIAKEFEEASERLQSIRKKAADSLPDLRKRIQSELEEYNRLAEISDTGADILELQTSEDHGNPEKATETRQKPSEPHDGGTGADGGAKPANGGGNNAERHVAHASSRKRGNASDEKPLDPNDVQLSDPDGVVVPDYRTEEADDGDEHDADTDDDSGLGFLGDDDA